jgi:ParB family transcriptional regulator, chromosome partitioning protein
MHRPNGYMIRKLLTDSELSGQDKHVRFVGRAAYEEAGGTVRIDLFGGEDDFYVQDAPLLHRLSVEKLQAVAKGVGSTGWKWVEVREEFGYAQQSRFHRLHPTKRRPTPQEAEVIDRLEADLSALREELQAIEQAASDEDRDFTEEETARTDELEAQIESLDDLRESAEATRMSFGAKQKAQSGVAVTLAHDGRPVLHEGLVRPEDRKQAMAALNQKATGEGGAAHVDGGESEEGASASLTFGRAAKAEFSQALMFNLTAHRTAATAAALIGNPHIAMVALVHALHSKHVGSYVSSPVCVLMHDKTSRVAELARGLTGGLAAKVMAEGEAAWGTRLSEASDTETSETTEEDEDATALFARLLTLDLAQLAELLAFHVARSYDVMRDREQSSVVGRVSGAIEKALGLDMSDWWSPTAETYLAGVSSAKRIEAVTQACGEAVAHPMEKMKKDESIAYATAKLEGKRWLPSPLISAATMAESGAAE